MKDYDYDYDRRLADGNTPYRLRGISRGDAILAGITLGFAGIAGIAGFGTGGGIANQSASMLVALVSVAGSIAFLRQGLSTPEAVEQQSPRIVMSRPSQAGVLAPAYNIDIFNVGSMGN